jgi:hypothetical protein
MRKVILHLCADTGSDIKPYNDNQAEYKCYLVNREQGVENWGSDVIQSIIRDYGKIHGIIANPPCTEFSTARSNGKARNPEEGMFLVKHCQRIIQEANPDWWVIENPARGVLKKYLGKPVYEYEPWWYGSPWTKKTALWGKFNIPPRLYKKWEDVPKIPELYVRPGRKKPSLAFMHKSARDLIKEFWTVKRPSSDMEFRSLCSQKFAQAFYEANR